MVTAIRVLRSADRARIRARGHGPPLAWPPRLFAHDHDQDGQHHQRYSIKEQAHDDRLDRRAVATDEIPPAAPRPERITDTERLAERHLTPPGDIPAAVGKVAFGHRVAAA